LGNIQPALTPRFAETPPARIVPALADEGTYIASEASFYRVLRVAGQMNRRGRAGECQASCRMACVMTFVYATPLFRVFEWLWTKAAWTTASRSGLSVTAAISVQFRV
jgi:hypothetical protein